MRDVRNRSAEQAASNMKYKTILLSVAIIAVLAGSGRCLAAPGKPRVAIIYLDGIKPYQDLNNVIVYKAGNKLNVRTFELPHGIENRVVEQNIRRFNPDVIVCIGHRAQEFYDSLDIAPVVLVYNSNLLGKLHPFSVLQYLQPKAKKVVAAFDKDITDSQADTLIALANRFNLNLSIKNAKSSSWKALLSGSNAIILGQGMLIIRTGPAKVISAGRPVVSVVDRSIETYKDLEQSCVRALPKIDATIDISDGAEQSSISKKLARINPAAIVCIGANSYHHCKSIQDNYPVLIVLRTGLMVRDINRWGGISGVNMLIEPKEQVEALSMLVQKPVTLTLPYNPENSELPVLKALLEPQSDVTFVPLPVSDSSRASRLVAKAFDNYDGIMVIPDRTISVAPIQKLLLEESLRRRKILVAMMHPYTKRGAMMAVSGVGKNKDALCEKIIELVNERLSHSLARGKIISPPVSISLNVRIIERLNYKIPKSLLDRAESIFGQ